MKNRHTKKVRQQTIVAMTTSHMTITNATTSAADLARRTGLPRPLRLALAILAAFAADATHVFGDGFGDFFGHGI